MLKTRRQPGDRRGGLHVEYPLRDSGVFVVVADRRRPPDRRGAEVSMEELAALLSRARQDNS